MRSCSLPLQPPASFVSTSAGSTSLVLQTTASLAAGPGRVPKRHLPPCWMRQGSCRWTKMQPRHQQLHPNTRAERRPRAGPSAGTAGPGAGDLTHKPRDPTRLQPPALHTSALPVPCYSKWELLACCANQSLSGCDKHRQLPKNRLQCHFRGPGLAEGQMSMLFPEPAGHLKRKQMFK